VRDGEDRYNDLVELAFLTRDRNCELTERERTVVSPALYAHTTARAFFPVPAAPALQAALSRLLRAREVGRLDDVLDLRWSVSFHRAGLRERYVLPERPEDLWARPFLGGGPFAGNGEVRRYRLDWAGWWIRYDEAALLAEENPLPDPAIFAPPKVVICQNGRTLRAALDERGYALKDTFLCGVLRPGPRPLSRHPRALVGLLCSRAVHFFYSHVFYGGHVGGGYLHFLRSFLVDVPLGEWTEPAAAAAAALVREREQAAGTAAPAALEEQIEALVAAALGLSPAEQEAVRAWAETEPKRLARERVRATGPARSRAPR
jgi:hypothetical protein